MSLLCLSRVSRLWLRQLPAALTSAVCRTSHQHGWAEWDWSMHRQHCLSVSLSFVKLDLMEESIWKILCSIFFPVVVREQWLGWCCIVRFIFRKKKVERNGTLVKVEIWSQGSWLCPWSCQYRSTDYEPNYRRNGNSLLPWSVGSGFLMTLPRDLLCSIAALMLSPCAMEVNPPQRDMKLKLLWFIWT